MTENDQNNNSLFNVDYYEEYSTFSSILLEIHIIFNQLKASKINALNDNKELNKYIIFISKNNKITKKLFTFYPSL